MDRSARLARVLQGLIAGGAQRIQVTDSALSTRIKFEPMPEGCCPQTLLDALGQSRVSQRPATRVLVDECRQILSEVACELVLVGCGRHLSLSAGQSTMTNTDEPQAWLQVQRPWRSLFRAQPRFDVALLRRQFALAPCRIWLNDLPLHRSQPVPTGYHELLVLGDAGGPVFCMRYSHSARPEREGDLYRYRLTSNRLPCWRGYSDLQGTTVHPAGHFEHLCRAVIRVAQHSASQQSLLIPVYRGKTLASRPLPLAGGCRVWLAVDAPDQVDLAWIELQLAEWLARLRLRVS